jgi:hypothetical protein
VTRQRVTFDGKELESDSVMTTCGVVEGSLITVGEYYNLEVTLFRGLDTHRARRFEDKPSS